MRNLHKQLLFRLTFRFLTFLFVFSLSLLVLYLTGSHNEYLSNNLLMILMILSIVSIVLLVFSVFSILICIFFTIRQNNSQYLWYIIYSFLCLISSIFGLFFTRLISIISSGIILS